MLSRSNDVQQEAFGIRFVPVPHELVVQQLNGTLGLVKLGSSASTGKVSNKGLLLLVCEIFMTTSHQKLIFNR